MLTVPMKRVFSYIVNNPYIKGVIDNDPEGLSGLLRAARDTSGDDLLAIYTSAQSVRDKLVSGQLKPLPGMDKEERIAQLNDEIGRLLTITSLKTVIYLDSWLKRTTIAAVEKKDYIDSCVNPDHYSINDNSREYSMLEELAYDRGFCNAEDIAEDIIAASLAFLNGEGQAEYKCGVYNPNWGRFYNPLPYPWNQLERKYDEISRGLHLRTSIPVMTGRDGEELDQIEVLDRILNNSNSHKTRNNLDLQEVIEDLDCLLVCALYGEGKDEYHTFLLLDQDDNYYFDYSAIRARVNTVNRTKNGRDAMMKVASILGLSREGKLSLARTGKVAIKERVESSAGIVTTRERKAAITTVEGLSEVKKIVKRGRPRKVEPAPVKRGRGRPRKTATV